MKFAQLSLLLSLPLWAMPSVGWTLDSSGAIERFRSSFVAVENLTYIAAKSNLVGSQDRTQIVARYQESLDELQLEMRNSNACLSAALEGARHSEIGIKLLCAPELNSVKFESTSDRKRLIQEISRQLGGGGGVGD